MSSTYGRPYRRVRLRVLARDGWRCRCGGECGHHVGVCGAPATEADHVHAVAEGGAVLDPMNLRATCRPCNRRLGVGVARRLAAARRRNGTALSW